MCTIFCAARCHRCASTSPCRGAHPKITCFISCRFEQSDRVGGRALSVTIDGHVVELGAGILHQENALMVQMAKAANLTLAAPPGADGLLALFDGAELVFRESSWRIITFIKLIWRYGFDPW